MILGGAFDYVVDKMTDGHFILLSDEKVLIPRNIENIIALVKNEEANEHLIKCSTCQKNKNWYNCPKFHHLLNVADCFVGKISHHYPHYFLGYIFTLLETGGMQIVFDDMAVDYENIIGNEKLKDVTKIIDWENWPF